MADKILEALNKLVEKQGGTTEDNKLIVDAINDLVETGGGGSSGYEKEETKVFWVDEQTITVTNTADEGYDPNYTVSDYTNNEDVLNGLENGTEGTCVIDGVEYRAVWSQEYVGYVKKYIAVYDGETIILELGLNGWITNNGFFTAEGTHTISVYYFAESIIVSEDFKKAVSKVSNMRYIGYGHIRISETTEDVVAGGTLYGNFSLTSNDAWYTLADGTEPTGETMNFDEVNCFKIIGFDGINGFIPQDAHFASFDSTDAETVEFPFIAWNLSGNTVTAESLNNNLAVNIELYKIEG